MSEDNKKRRPQLNGNGEDESVKKPRLFQLRQLKGDPVQSRRTNDEIHTSVDMHPVMTALMDTPQFQRLRQIKQTGVSEYVYCNTNHNRFEHSIGVAFLARKMCERIRTRQPQLPCTAKDVLCVQLAGLLHDIGHGPFSHSYEDFVKNIQPAYIKQNPHLKKHYECFRHDKAFRELDDNPKDWEHEEVSLKMIDALLEHLGLGIDLDNLDEPLQQIGDGIDATTMRVFQDDLGDKESILTSRDFVFIKECILGGPIGHLYKSNDESFYTLVGRKEEQEWMYDIVSNKHSGLDVDKMDYFARDQRRAFGTSGQFHIQMIEDCYVAWGECTHTEEKEGKDPGCFRCRSWENKDNKHLMICYGEKCEKSAIKFFQKRLDLHETIYRHKTVQATVLMIMDILSLADPFFRVSTVDEFSEDQNERIEWLPISRAQLDIRAFERLTDAVIEQIASTPDAALKEAKKLIRRLRCRDLYKCVGRYDIDMEDECDRKLWELSSEAEEFKKCLVKQCSGSNIDIVDFIVERCEVDHGAKEKNPVEKMRFIKKRDMPDLKNPVHTLPTATLYNAKRLKANLPRTFRPKAIRLYSRTNDKRDLLRDAFDTLIHSYTDKRKSQNAGTGDGREAGKETSEQHCGASVVTPVKIRKAS